MVIMSAFQAEDGGSIPLTRSKIIMKRIQVKDLKSHIGKEILLQGFIQVIRDQKKIQFIVFRDVTGTCQLVSFNNEENAKIIRELPLESVIKVKGLVKEEKQAPGGFEVEIKELVVLSKAEPELPIPVVEKGEGGTELDKRLDWRWLDLRKEKNILAYKIWTALEHGFRDYWEKENYIQIHSPKFMDAPSESGAEVFKVDYFDDHAYLAQSPQFYKQMAMAAGFEKAFEVGPVFRAEPSFTSRHATEFTGYDFEISYVESEEDVMQEAEKLISHALSYVEKNYGSEIEKVYGEKLIIPKIPFPRVTMKEAKELLKPFKIESDKEGDLNQTEEIKLSEIIKEKYNHDFVFVTDYPVAFRPFYHMKKDNDTTRSTDLLYKGVEIMTAAQREHRHETLVAQAKDKGLKPESIRNYLNFFKYGCPPHGGAGIGPERILMKICGFSNIREAQFIYRGVKRLTP